MSDKMREEFEELAKRHHGVYSVGIVCGHYSNEKVNQDWLMWCIAWQASRAALVVELPVVVDIYDEHFGDHYEYFEVDDIKKALDAAGVKYEQR